VRVLVDTHVLLWWLGESDRLTDRHRELLAEPSNEIWFSAVSIAEMSIKASLGKLTAPDDAAAVLIDGGFDELPLSAQHADRLRTLPWHHRDPFDRMLIAQAQVEGVTVATVDKRFAEYDVRTV
jgi:PIN domain nuclease of toxin-antitoxin system